MSIGDSVKIIIAAMPPDSTLIAVSKTRTLEEIREAYQAGTRDFGENKVQELVEKYDLLEEKVNWHLLGHLQTNKVKYIVGRVKLIHSLDSIKLLKEIEKQYSKKGLIAETLIQINIGREASKTGINIDKLQELILEASKCSFVKIEGLMAIIPIGSEISSRHYFKEMKNIFDDLALKKYDNIKMKYLSMGMSQDYKFALEEGSNMIRIGQGIFGKRDYYNQGGV
ncbi:MAG TPA: YggS family pyridoxal phosphate-dependent enzyme [Clostridiaceae bacterium]